MCFSKQFFQTLLDIENTPLLVGMQSAQIVVKMNNLENMVDTAKIAKQYYSLLANFFIGTLSLSYF
jgi:hypothetical protein